MLPTSLPVDAVLVALVGILIQLLKPWLELAVSPESKEHDPLIRSAAVALAVALTLIQRGLPADGPTVIALLGYALGTALTAIGGYHLLAGSPGTATDGTAGDTTPDAPPPLRLVSEPASLPKASASAATTPPA